MRDVDNSINHRMFKQYNNSCAVIKPSIYILYKNIANYEIFK